MAAATSAWMDSAGASARASPGRWALKRPASSELVLEGADVHEVHRCPNEAEQEAALNWFDAEFELPALAVVGGRILLIFDVDRFQVRRAALCAAKDQKLAPRVNNDRRLDHVLTRLRKGRLRLSGSAAARSAVRCKREASWHVGVPHRINA
jgi:hypothetical protein